MTLQVIIQSVTQTMHQYRRQKRIRAWRARRRYHGFSQRFMRMISGLIMLCILAQPVLPVAYATYRANQAPSFSTYQQLDYLVDEVQTALLMQREVNANKVLREFEPLFSQIQAEAADDEMALASINQRGKAFRELLTQLSRDQRVKVGDKPADTAPLQTFLNEKMPLQPAEDFTTLPFQSLQPREDNLPTVFSPVALKMARNNTNDAFDKPEYLASINEATITPTLRDQARALGNHPVKIFEFVRNTIEWQPTWGGQQTAEMTLDVKRGNAQDISTLLIALLRAANIPARYVHGTVDVPAEKFQNMVGNFDSLNAAMIFAASAGLPSTGVVRGGRIEAVRMDHVWVEAAVDFYPSRGVKNIEPDSWMSLDASHKQYEYLQGLDAAAITQLNGDALANQFVQSGIVNETEGWVQGLDATIIESAQNTAQQKLEQHIENMTDPTVGEVIGGRKIIEKRIEVLPTGMPYEHVVRGQRYADLPASLQVQVQLGLGYDPFTGDYAQRINKPLYELNQRHLTISFKPASKADEDALAAMIPANVTDVSQLPSVLPASIRVIPEIKRGDEVLASGSVMALGEEVRVGYQISYAGYAYFVRHYDVIAGSYLGLGVVGTNMSAKTFDQLKTDLEKTKTVLTAQNEAELKRLTREQLLGDMFVTGIQSYYAQYISQSRIMGQQANINHLAMPIIGTFGYEPHQRTFFGLNRGIEAHGMYMNVYVSNVVQAKNGNKDQYIAFMQQTGMLSSSLEHAVPEQMFTDPNETDPIKRPNGFSAAKALSIAAAQGQRIYTITPATQNIALPNIRLDATSMNEIRAALASGKHVTTHTDLVTVSGYKGAGYVILDPDTGAGVYKISGGKNGGFLFLLGLFILLMFVALLPVLFAVALTAVLVTNLIILLALGIGALLVGGSWMGIFDNIACKIGVGIIAGAIIAFLAPIVAAIIVASLVARAAITQIIQRLIGPVASTGIGISACD